MDRSPKVARQLRIPRELRAAVIGGVAVLACSSTPSTGPFTDGGPLSDASPSEGSRDASLDGGPCTIKIPAGTVCRTTCYNIGVDPVMPYACQVYCTPPKKGESGICSCNGGVALEGGMGFCPGGLNCELESEPDGGTQVLC